MKKFNSLTNRSGLVRWVVLSVSVMLGVSSCKPDYDLDTHFPEWLGTSVYQTLQDGFEGEGGKFYRFSYYVRLIDTLNQKKVLDKTGSKTLFVADDEAFERFFGPDCPFRKADGTGVTKFEELSVAQMKMILNGSMLNNVYQVAALSTTGGSDQTDPVVGNCMRRVSASDYTDSIPLMHLADLPDPEHNEYWNNVRGKAATVGVPVLQDGTNRPIVFFVDKFLQMNGITTEDYDFLFNQPKGTRQPTDASVNGVKIEYQNKKCFNGFLHVMSDVVYLLPNMAEYLSQKSTNSKSTIYGSIIERFSAPYSDQTMTAHVKELIDQGYIKNPALKAALADDDAAVYVKRYFSDNNKDYTDRANPLTKLPGGGIWGEQQSVLRFDPGWNGYFTPVPGSSEENAKLVQHNMAVMLVPTDEAIKRWWLFRDGKTMRERYGKAIYKNLSDAELEAMTPAQIADDMDSIPFKVISKLVNNNMLYSLVGSVPSKFATVLNDANDPMFEGKVLDDVTGESVDGVQAAIASIDSVVMCCNGAIYFTNKVYAPTAYRSVSYPTLVNEKLDIINTAIENKTLSFSVYLNSMVSTYSLFVPEVRDETNEPNLNLQNKLVWFDPLSFSFYQDTVQAIVFGYDYDQSTIVADWYWYDLNTNAIYGDRLEHLIYKAPAVLNEEENASSQIIMNRLGDLLDYHIIIGDIEKDNPQTDMTDYRFFQTKGRGTVRIKTVPDMEHNYASAEVAGGWQIERGDQVKIKDRKDFSETGNGRTYILDRPLFTSRKSAYDIISDADNYPEFELFYKLMNNASGRKKASKVKNTATKKAMYQADGKFLFDTKLNNHAIGSEKNITTLNTFHYTLYVPDKDSLQALLDKHVIFSEDTLSAILQLYTDSTAYWSKTLKLKKAEYEELQRKFRNRIAKQYGRETLTYGAVDVTKYPNWADDPEYINEFVESERTRLKNFLKYHIQDNSVYVNAPFNAGKNDDGSSAEWAKFETAFMDNGEFTRLTVSGGQNIFVKDDAGNTRKVLKNTYSQNDPTKAPLWNIMCREYEFNQASITASTTYSSKIETSSYVVIHQIDGALMHPSIVNR